MKTVQIETYGTNEVVRLIDAEIPAVAADEVLVKVHTAGINAIDWKIRNGAGKRIGLELPISLGGEFAGVIEKVGSAVSGFQVGNAVFGMVKTGAFSEYVAAKASDITKMTKSLDFTQASSIALCGLTAWQGLFDNGDLKPSQRILITGASGSVGSLAVQFAKSKGAHVTALASRKNLDYVKSLGADEVIDYQTQKFEEVVEGLDLVLDAVGGETYEKARQTLKRGGKLVTAVAFPAEDDAIKFGIETKRVFCKANGSQLKEISDLFEAGKVRARVAATFPLAEIKDALELSESGKANGKIVLKIG